MLIEKGRQLLRKDNLLDEELAFRADTWESVHETRIGTIEALLDDCQTRLGRLTANFNALQQKLLNRMSRVEQELDRSDAVQSRIAGTPLPPK